MGAARQRPEWNRARALWILEVGAPMILPELDGPGGDGHLVVAVPPLENVLPREDGVALQAARLAHADAARPARDAAARESGPRFEKELGDAPRTLDGLLPERIEVHWIEGIVGAACRAGHVERQVHLVGRSTPPHEDGLAVGRKPSRADRSHHRVGQAQRREAAELAGVDAFEADDERGKLELIGRRHGEVRTAEGSRDGVAAGVDHHSRGDRAAPG